MSDVGCRHYAEEGWRGQGVGTLTFRLVPWAEYRKMRAYVDEVENMLHCWHATGYDRARDVFETWGDRVTIPAFCSDLPTFLDNPYWSSRWPARAGVCWRAGGP